MDELWCWINIPILIVAKTFFMLDLGKNTFADFELSLGNYLAWLPKSFATDQNVYYIYGLIFCSRPYKKTAIPYGTLHKFLKCT